MNQAGEKRKIELVPPRHEWKLKFNKEASKLERYSPTGSVSTISEVRQLTG